MTKYLNLAVLLLGAAIAAPSTNGAEAGAASGKLYVMSNSLANSVLAFDRASDGSLTFAQEIRTRGLGTGVTLDPLASQGAIALRADGKLLLAVNPASGDLTAFRVTATGLQFGSIISSGGSFPVSVTIHNSLVYVLNQLGEANVKGFTVTDSGILQAIPSSTQPLAGGALAMPAEVSFIPDGGQLLVTEKGTNLIDIFQVSSSGQVGLPLAQASRGKTPFGFAFGPSDSVIVSEVENRLPMAATVSSYRLTNGPHLAAVSPAVPNEQSGSCWVATTGNIAWIVNTGSATIAAYQIGTAGDLTLLDAEAGSTGDGSNPIDLAASPDGKYLYVLKSTTGEIAIFQIAGSSLTPLFTQGDLPLSIQGIAVQ
ncbi:MAG TPA: beta-propeller fold lactonase family protein [Chthoniobacterales bacterium]